jgi:hypothetical protein
MRRYERVSTLLCSLPTVLSMTGANCLAMLPRSAPCSTVYCITVTCSSAARVAGALRPPPHHKKEGFLTARALPSRTRLRRAEERTRKTSSAARQCLLDLRQRARDWPTLRRFDHSPNRNSLSPSSLPAPQSQTSARAMLWIKPAAMAVAVDRPLTCTGVLCCTNVPSPNCPLLF